ncbi:hypothetical protein UY3_07686 [Chelonia mydas]|uniref:Uncharacterized protein n=1 Tax=Chelonia mydas TaxID=8469 RepID=M7BDA7_CHEMY|nr:hypothetical protein UY3_07686 [Chelonia mydas]
MKQELDYDFTTHYADVGRISSPAVGKHICIIKCITFMLQLTPFFTCRLTSDMVFLMEYPVNMLVLQYVKEWYVYTTHRIGGQRSMQRGSIYRVWSRYDKSIPECSPIDSCTPPLREAQAELTGEWQQLTHLSEDTTVN